jgi:hypothetical protein
MSARSNISRAVACAILLGASFGSVFAGSSSFDSVQEFSATQGAGNWQYGYYTSTGDADSFVLMSYYISEPVDLAFTNAWQETPLHPPYASLWADGGHPNGANNGPVHDAVRRWTSGADGVVHITGNYSTTTIYGSTLVGVIADNTPIWSDLATGYSEQTFEISHAVSSGSHLDFFINSNGDDFDDSTNFAFTGEVTAVPEPKRYVLALVGLVAVGSLVRRRKSASA